MKLKVCGMTRQDDIDVAQELGFNYCGFIFHPESPRHVTPKQAAALETGRLLRVGVFVNHTVAEILGIMRSARLDYAQLHGAQTHEQAGKIGEERIIRVLWPSKYASMAELEQEAADYKCAFFLLDAGKHGGGSGCVLPWELLRGLHLPAPWFLAGGLNAANAAEAARLCQPSALDFNSGLEDSPGCKNHNKMRAAALAARCEAKS